MNPRLDVHMLSFHWVKFNPIFRFLNIICVDCASEFTCLEMPLFAGLPTATEWCCQSKFLQLSLNLPSFLLVLLYQHTSSWYCACVVNLLHNSRVVCFVFLIFCTHSVSVQGVYVCACMVSMVMQYGFGRGGAGDLRISSHLLHWPSFVSPLCPVCCAVALGADRRSACKHHQLLVMKALLPLRCKEAFLRFTEPPPHCWQIRISSFQWFWNSPLPFPVEWSSVFDWWFSASVFKWGHFEPVFYLTGLLSGCCCKSESKIWLWGYKEKHGPCGCHQTGFEMQRKHN